MSKKNRFVISIIVLGFVCPAEIMAQKDSVYRIGQTGSKLLRGRIVKTSPFEVTVETSDKTQDVPVREIKKISFSGEPRALGRAREHFENQRYNDCLENIQKIEEQPNSNFVQQEISFLEAFATGKKALRGDSGFSTTSAEQLVENFVAANRNSYRLVVAVDLYAQLLMANGKIPAARAEFAKLTKSQWPTYVARGHFFEGEAAIHENNLDEAEKSYRALSNMKSNDAEMNQFRLIAECQLAKLAALKGNADRAVSAIEQIIQNENSDNSKLFAYAYNALGTCYLMQKELKKACRAFLHTELLYSSESDAHAEALYNLAKIWPQLKETDRANRAREVLTSRYGNTIWASKL